MAGTGNKNVTMQGFGIPVSAAGQGGKAGPQASSSSYRSSTVVGNLAFVEYNATRHQSSSHHCNKSPDEFCYVCGEFDVAKNRRRISEKLKSIYKDCFGLEVVNQDVNWGPPSMICNSCRSMLSRWDKSRNQKELKFTKPMIWSEPSSRDACYVCMTNTIGFNSTNKTKILYPNVPSVEKPTNLGVKSAVQESMQVDENSEEDNGSNSEDDEYHSAGENKAPETFDQKELNDLIRNLGLPKDGAEYLAAALKKKNLLSKGIMVCGYRNREKGFRKYFAKDENASLTYCSDVKGLVDELKPNIYNDEQWRLFIDSSKRSFKAVLLHNGNTFAPIPIAHSTKLKETYQNLQIVLEKIKFAEHQWQICGDLKIITLILGQQSGFTKYPCFLCLWDSRDRKNHYEQKVWPNRTDFNPGTKNVIREPLVNNQIKSKRQ